MDEAMESDWSTKKLYLNYFDPTQKLWYGVNILHFRIHYSKSVHLGLKTKWQTLNKVVLEREKIFFGSFFIA